MRVFHKENGGVSSARNVGLDNAQGEWIAFVDSDDWVEKCFLESFVEYLEADLIVGNAIKSQPRGFLPRGIASGYHQVRSESLRSSDCLTQELFRTPWGKLYRYSVLMDLRFDERMRIGEDTVFVFLFLSRSKDLFILDEANEEDRTCYMYKSTIAMYDKYQLSVEIAVYSLERLEEAYQKLGIRNLDFEIFIPHAFYMWSLNDRVQHADLWYSNKTVEKVCLRRSRRVGIVAWLRTWLAFHLLFKLKTWSIRNLNPRHPQVANP